MAKKKAETTPRPFTRWVEEAGFHVRHSWDEHKQAMVGPGRLHLFDYQRRIFEVAFNIREGRFDFETVILSAPKKSGKSTWAAATTAWCAEEVFTPGSEIYLIANDLEQAEDRVFADLVYHFEHRPDCYTTKSKIVLPNGTFIQAIAQEYKSASGARHAMTVWDELWGFLSDRSRRMWAEMTPIPTVPMSLRLVVTYAGFEGESDLLWDTYLKGVGTDEHKDGAGKVIPELSDLPCWTNGRMFTYWDTFARLPWHTDEYIEGQANSLRAVEFLRLFRNRWTTGRESFIDENWWKRSNVLQSSADVWHAHPYRNLPLSVALDAAPKKDTSSVAAVGYNAAAGKIGLVFHKIWTPIKGEDFDFETTFEAYLLQQKKRYNIATVRYDPYQLHKSSMTLRRAGLRMVEFPQNGDNMTNATSALFDVFRNKTLETYPDDECLKHVKNAIAVNSGRGYRLAKEKSRGEERRYHKPIDFTVALAMAIHDAIERGGSDVKPIVVTAPFADMQSRPTQQMFLPYELRD